MGQGKDTLAKDKIDELKDDRKLLRGHVKNRICKMVVSSAEGGFLPSIADIVDEVMDEIAGVVERCKNVPPEAWPILLQKIEPSFTCRRTADFLKDETP